MSQENDKQKPADNMERLNEEASACDCGSGCGCHASGAPGKTRWVVGAVVLLAAGTLAARAVLKSDNTTPQPTAPAFAAQSVAETGLESAVGEAVPQKDAQTAAVATAAQPKTTAETASGTVANSAEAAKPEVEPVRVIGTEIAAFAELNTLASEMDAVFLFLPAKKGEPGTAPVAQVQGAARTIAAQGKKVGLFTLKADSRDYGQISTQMPVPAVLALVKGRGMTPVAGEITETKLVQGYVAASSGGGGCGPASGGCGPSGCK